MGKTVMGAVVSLDGFIADDNDGIGRRLFDLTDGSNGEPAAGEHVFVVTHQPLVFGSGRPFFATGGLAGPLLLENPSTVVRGDRVTHLVYDVSR